MVERDLCKPKHTVFVDSSDDDNEPSLKKLRYDSTKNYEDNSNLRRGSSGKESSKVVSIVKKSRSDSAKMNDKKSSSDVDQNRGYSSEEVYLMKKTKSSKTEKIEKNSSTVKEVKISRSVSNSDEDEEPPENKSISDPTKDEEKNSKPKHTVFVDSSDDENEPLLKKLRYDTTKNYEDYSDKKKVSPTKESAKIETAVIRSRSDSFKKNDKNSYSEIDQNRGSSSEEVSLMKKSKSNTKKMREKNSLTAEEEKLSRSVSRPAIPSNSDEDEEPTKNNSISDPTKKSENNSDQKRGSSTKEDSQIDSVIKKSRSDFTNSDEDISSHADDQNRESSEDDSQLESVKKSRLATKRNETELKCPLCKEHRTHVVSTLRAHLRRKHSTNLGLAEMFLRCDCGHESLSEMHLQECKIGNYTLIRRNDGPIQTFHDKVTPQCFLCEIYPRTAKAYAHHLEKHHDTSLKSERRYLICSCGYEVTSSTGDPSHTKKCDGRKFTLHDLDEK